MMNNKKRGLIIAYNGLGNSGVPNLIFQVVKALSSHYYFDILVFEDTNFYSEQLKSLGARIISFQEKRSKSKIRRIGEYFFRRDKNYYTFCKKLIKENGYDSVHSFKESDSAPFFQAAKECNVSKIIYHCTVIQDGPKNIFRRLIFKHRMRKSLKLSNIRIGVSEKCCKIAFHKFDSFILHNSYNENLYTYKNVTPSSGLKLLHISSFSDNKNQFFSVKVLKYLCALDNSSSLVLIGDSGDAKYKNKVTQFIADNNLENNVLFARSSQINDIIQNISYYILPSKKEGASIVAIEAQAQGIRIFASDTLSPDMNVGGCTFLDLHKGPIHWARTIYDYYIQHGSERKRLHLESFSSAQFEKNIKDIYKID